MPPITAQFTTNLRQSLKNSFKIATEMKHGQITPLHLLYGLIVQKGSIAAEILAKSGIDKEKIISALSTLARTDRPESFPAIDPESKTILEKAAVLSFKNNHRYIGTEHLLCAFTQVKTPTFGEIVKNLKIDASALKQTALNVLQSVNRFPEITSLFGDSTGADPEQIGEKTKTIEKPVKRQTKKTPALDFFACELTSQTAQKNLDPVIGRDKEIQRLIQILCRRTKNNPVLLGDPGVGKTAIVEGLAQRIFSCAVPDELQRKKLWRLDLGLLVAGTIYRGEFESRLKQLLDEVKSDPNLILFIDELHTIVGAGSASGALDAANMLKPALARGELRCIGATTLEEYKKHIESDAALERRFQPILVNEPNRDETLAILRGISANYEIYHGLKISEEAIAAAVDFSLRYRPDKFLPDKAIDLLDEAASAKKLTLKSSRALRQLKNLEKELRGSQEKKQQAVMAENFEKAIELKKEEEELIKKIRECEQKIAKQRPRQLKKILTADDIAKVMSESLGLPMADLLDEEKTRFLTLEDEIKKRLIGQDEAVAAVVRALSRARLGLANPQRPMASFLMAGPSGCGKTLLAKTLAEIFFKDQAAFISLDMSEFAESFQSSKLIGSPAGYVGYKEGNKFTDKIKARPHSVILFDEIDKAHPGVLNLLLQILDEGHLTDAVGKKINFKNTVILMTTNLGNEHFASSAFGFQDNPSESLRADENIRESIKNSVLKDLKDHFRPEFLNRLDSVLIFRPLNSADLEKIVELRINELNERLKKKSISLVLSPAARKHLAQKARAMDQGARAIAKVIQKEVEEPLTDILLREKISPAKQIIIKLTSDKIILAPL